MPYAMSQTISRLSVCCVCLCPCRLSCIALVPHCLGGIGTLMLGMTIALHCKHHNVSLNCKQPGQSALDHDVQAAFQHLAAAVGLAADVAGMPSKCAPRRVVAAPDKPFYDTECRAAKKRVRNARDPAARKILEREYHSLVRTKRRAFRLGRLRALLEQQYTQPRSFWKLLRSAQTPIPVSLQPVQIWDDYLDKLADIGQVENCALPPAAFPTAIFGGCRLPQCCFF